MNVEISMKMQIEEGYDDKTTTKMENSRRI
jgi:hypothetical protein